MLFPVFNRYIQYETGLKVKNVSLKKIIFYNYLVFILKITPNLITVITCNEIVQKKLQSVNLATSYKSEVINVFKNCNFRPVSLLR